MCVVFSKENQERMTGEGTMRKCANASRMAIVGLLHVLRVPDACIIVEGGGLAHFRGGNMAATRATLAGKSRYFGWRVRLLVVVVVVVCVEAAKKRHQPLLASTSF